MSGYAGDFNSEHALIINENGIHASSMMLVGPVLTECQDCGGDIDPRRIEALASRKMKCIRCFSCQELFDKKPSVRIKMLDRIL